MAIKMPCPRCNTLVVRKSICPRCGGGVGVKPSASRRGYGKTWQRLSALAISLQPWCSRCKSTNDLTTDHRAPLALVGERELSLADVDVLCRKCNSSKGKRI